MKREYQVKGCIEEDCEVRAAEAGEEAQFWSVYKRDAGRVEWAWVADFDHEADARRLVAVRESVTGRTGESAAEVLTVEGLAHIRSAFNLASLLSMLAVCEAETIPFDEFLELITRAMAEQGEGLRLVYDAAHQVKDEKATLAKALAAQVTTRGGEA